MWFLLYLNYTIPVFWSIEHVYHMADDWDIEIDGIDNTETLYVKRKLCIKDA